jgi:hypothetical protein
MRPGKGIQGHACPFPKRCTPCPPAQPKPPTTSAVPPLQPADAGSGIARSTRGGGRRTRGVPRGPHHAAILLLRALLLDGDGGLAGGPNDGLVLVLMNIKIVRLRLWSLRLLILVVLLLVLQHVRLL